MDKVICAAAEARRARISTDGLSREEEQTEVESLHRREDGVVAVVTGLLLVAAEVACVMVMQDYSQDESSKDDRE